MCFTCNSQSQLSIAGLDQSQLSIAALDQSQLSIAALDQSQLSITALDQSQLSISVLCGHLAEAEVLYERVYPALGVSAPGEGAGLPHQGVEQDGLPHLQHDNMIEHDIT